MGELQLVRVVAPRFVAGLILRDGIVTEAAPILRRDCLGQRGREVKRLATARGWTLERVR